MSPVARPVDRELAQAIVDGKVEVLGIDEIVKRLGVSRSTLERWVRNGRNSVLGGGPVGDVAANLLEGKTNFPSPDIYIGTSPKWVKNTVVEWLMKNSSK